jgi:single-strand DNA-binding protein
MDNQTTGFEKETSYFDVETWGKLAEACYSKSQKGRGVRVVGRLKQNRWNDPDGKPHSRVTIVAEHVEFRPIIKKDDKPALEIEFDEDNLGKNAGGAVMASAENELERVVF